MNYLARLRRNLFESGSKVLDACFDDFTYSLKRSLLNAHRLLSSLELDVVAFLGVDVGPLTRASLDT
jgi:hypothetical protein